jgi:outer membrane protein assembly factor BamB
VRAGLRLTVFAFALVALSGCQTLSGLFSDDDDVLPPAELVEFNPSIDLVEAWSVNAGNGPDERLGSVRPFFIDGEIWVGDHEGLITVVDADSGRVIKRFETERSLSGGPSVHDDLVLMGTFNGELVALDRDGGSERWRARLSSELLSFPVVHDGIVIARCVDGRTFGFDRADGTRLWVYDRSIPLLTLRGNSDPLARAGQVYLGYDDGAVVGLDVATGGLNWEQRVSVPEGRTELERLADIDGPMAIVGTDLYLVTYAGRLAALATESGRVLWVKDLASYSGLSLQRTQLAAVDSDDGVWLIDRRNGTTLWTDDRLVRRELTRPAFLEDFLIVLDAEGYLHAYNLESGEFAGRERVTRSGPASAPSVVGNRAYILDRDGTLSAWSVRR